MKEIPNYITALNEATKYIVRTHSAPKIMSLPGRVIAYGTCPLLCAPCGCWSTFWRCIACPFVCVFNGPMYSCSNNGCTNPSDAIIGVYLKHIGESTYFTRFDIHHAATVDLVMALGLIATLQSIMNVEKFEPFHYILCDVVIRPFTSHMSLLPANCVNELAAFDQVLRFKLNM